jgi:hypothetical protein
MEKKEWLNYREKDNIITKECTATTSQSTAMERHTMILIVYGSTTVSTSKEPYGSVTASDKNQDNSMAQPYKGKLNENAWTTHTADYIQQ